MTALENASRETKVGKNAVRAAQLLERGFSSNGLGWLRPALGTVDNLVPIDASPPNLRDEMCGGKRKRPASDEDEDTPPPTSKTLKTSTSRRKLPFHPQLTAIGFLEFVELQKKAGSESRIFADLEPNKYGNHAWYALKRFNDSYLPKAIKMEPRQSFYSFRHSWRDALRRINAQPATLQALGSACRD